VHNFVLPFFSINKGWAFAAVACVEAAVFRRTGRLIPFSEQQLVDCDRGCAGCNGGRQDRAFVYIRQAGGIVPAKEYPYTARVSMLLFFFQNLNRRLKFNYKSN
jgi:hypothetical protein